ncbi:MAG: hypothetical protein QOD76_1560 [Solirubrobacteraceae bacterium]|jgi:hypothetical protein|nr:hypothetical protein [Solirubrobacteraceae bacterium]
MSRENVEKLRKEWDIWMTGNLGDLSLLDAEVVYADTMVPDHAHFREGKIAYYKSYRDPAEALEAAGLRQQ